MISGSTKRRAATRHLLVQVLAVALAGVSLVLHVTDYGIPSLAALALLGASTAVMGVGNFLGGMLVYRMGMRVG